MTRLGMDVDAVERIGHGLQTDAEALTALTARVDALVRRLPGLWDGKDASDFVGTWWPRHRASLQAVRSQISGLGQSALNNASEQRGASAATGGSGSVGGGSSLTGADFIRQYENATIPVTGWRVGDLIGLTHVPGTFLTAFDAAEGFTSGDPAKAVDAAASVTASILKSAGAEAPVPILPLYLSGVIIAEVQELHRDWAEVDKSSSGMASAGQYIVQHPMDALAGAGQALDAALPRLIGIFKP